MRVLNNLLLKWKLVYGFSLPLVLMVIISTLVYVNLGALLESSERVNHTHQSIEFGDKVETAVVGMETGLRGFLVAGNDDFLGPFHMGQTEFDELFVKAKKHTIDSPEQLQHLHTLKKLKSEWISVHAAKALSIRREVTQGKEAHEEFKYLSSQSNGKELFAKFRSILLEIDRVFADSDDHQTRVMIQNILVSMLRQETSQRGYLIQG
jgi:methyl-accepting chemotaxis protein